MDTPVSLVAVNDPAQHSYALSLRRARTRAFALAGLAISGWMGFLVLAVIVLLSRAASMGALEAEKAEPPQPVRVAVDARAEAREVKPPEVRVPEAKPPEPPEARVPEVKPPEARVPEVNVERRPAPVPEPISILTTYEERRRIQELVQQADPSDYQDGNVAAARQVYAYAARKGWAPAALALALTYDPHELRRRGVFIAADTAKARACYTKARELMNAMVAFYLSRLPGAGDEKC